MHWHADHFWEYLSWKWAFAYTCELLQGNWEHPVPCPHQQAVLVQCFIFHWRWQHPRTILHQTVSREYILVCSGHITHTVNAAALPIAIKNSDLDPTKSLPCYFNHPLLFTLPVTLRLNLLFSAGQKGPHKGKECLTGLPSLAIPVLAAAPARHHCHLLATPAGRWLSRQQFSQEVLASKIYSLLSCWQFLTTLI